MLLERNFKSTEKISLMKGTMLLSATQIFFFHLMETPNCPDYLCEKILFAAFFFEFLWPVKVSNFCGSLVH